MDGKKSFDLIFSYILPLSIRMSKDNFTVIFPIFMFGGKIVSACTVSLNANSIVFLCAKLKNVHCIKVQCIGIRIVRF